MTNAELNFVFNLKPEKAVAYLKSKGYKISFNWKEVWQEAHAKAFTVAKAMDLDILSTIRNSVEDALANGKTLQQFKDELKPELQKKGWWGKKEMTDPNTGEVKEVQLGSPHRLKTIYQTNLNVAYKTGQYADQMDNASDRPFWMYVAALDSNTRPAHRALHGKVFRYDDPIWNKIYPPNDWNCRCTVRPLTTAQVKEKGLPVEPAGTEIPPKFQPPEWAYNPAKAPIEDAETRLYEKAVAFGNSGDVLTMLNDNFTAQTFENFLNDFLKDKRSPITYVTAGYLKHEVLTFLINKGTEPAQPQIYLTKKRLAHILKDAPYKPTAAELRALPEQLKNAKTILWDKQKQNVVYVLPSDVKTTKAAVEINFTDKKLKLQGNQILTITKVKSENFNDKTRYEFIKE